MDYRRLGRSGLQVSSLVLGTMNFGNPTDRQEAIRIIDAAIKLSEAQFCHLFVVHGPLCLLSTGFRVVISINIMVMEK